MSTKVVLVGEAWGQQEAEELAPFVGASGQLLRKMLEQVGIKDYYLTNVFNLHPVKNALRNLCQKRRVLGSELPPLVKSPMGYLKEQYFGELERLWNEIYEIDPKVIIALGNTALWALCREDGIKAWRGYMTKTYQGDFKVMPTWHPTAILRQYSLRTTSLMDLRKAVASDREDFKRTVRIPETIEDLDEIYYTIKTWNANGILACDIETEGSMITEVGFASSDRLAFTIPFSVGGKSYWSNAESEVKAWELVRDICKRFKIVGQNFTYDMQYLWKVAGIPVPGFHGDTMLQHHALQPEMEKSLGYLASLYTNAPRWKHMRKENKE